MYSKISVPGATKCRAYSSVTQSEVGLTANVVTRTFPTHRVSHGHTADMSV